MPAFHSEGKLIRVPMEAYLKPHPRNTLVTQRHRRSASEFAAEQTQRPHGNARLRHAVGANDAGSAALVTPS